MTAGTSRYIKYIYDRFIYSLFAQGTLGKTVLFSVKKTGTCKR